MVVYFEVVIWAILAASLLASVFSFFSALFQPARAFRKNGQKKYVWLLLIFVFGVFAAAPYLHLIRPKLILTREVLDVRNVRYGN